MPTPEMTPDTAQKLSDFAYRASRQQAGFYGHQPKKVADVMAQLLARRGYGRVQGNAQLQTTWEEIAGPALAKFSRANRVNRGKLEVTVSSSTMMQELTFEKKRLLTALKAALPEAKISDLKLRVGAVSRKR